MRVMLACNDERNGLFVGKFDSLIVENDDCDVLFCLEGEPIKMAVDKNSLRVMNKRFMFHDCTEWYGNWSWNMYVMDKATIITLLNMLHEKKWDCIEGLEKQFEIWASDAILKVEDLEG